MELRSAACIVRSYRPGDAAVSARHGNNRQIWLNLRDRFPHPYTEEHGAAYITHVLAQPTQTSFAIDVGGEAVGGISLHPGTDIERFSAEMGYWLGEEFWGRGITTAAIVLLTRHAFTDMGFIRIFAVPFVRNAASSRALEKAGYLREGLMRQSAIKDGIVEDQFLYAALKSEWADPSN
jgi:[ribosomal protein S5]-alanine N-acetyltransferase